MWLCFYYFLSSSACVRERVCVCVYENQNVGVVSHLTFFLAWCQVLFNKQTLSVFVQATRSLSGLMSTLLNSLEMQASSLDPQFILGPQQAKIPGRRRGRPPIRKLEFHSDFIDTFSALKVPKKRGRKPGFKVGLSLSDFFFTRVK